MNVTSNSVALSCFLSAKAIGTIGMVLSYCGNHVLGGTFVLLAGVLLVATIFICVSIMKKQEIEAKSEEEIVRRLFAEGRLQQILVTKET